jgi:hypothetical protein
VTAKIITRESFGELVTEFLLRPNFLEAKYTALVLLI